jgi:hypothetical protein
LGVVCDPGVGIMEEIGLYYPYAHVRDDTWLKATALYLPKLARLRPSGFPRLDSPTAKALQDEIGFILDLDPVRHATSVADEFTVFVQRNGGDLRRRYDLRDFRPGSRHYYRNRERFGGAEAFVDWIHRDKFTESLVRVLEDEKLAVIRSERAGDGDTWVALHERLAAVYTVALADRIARSNRMRTITDQVETYGALNGWTIDTLADVLLSDAPADDPLALDRRGSGEVAEAYAIAAIGTVVPADLSAVPVQEIIRVRQTLAAEFAAFREHVDALMSGFAELAQLSDPDVFAQQVNSLVDHELLKPMKDLDSGLRRLGLQPARAVLGVKSFELPALAGMAAYAAHIPTTVGTVGTALAFIGSSAVTANRVAHERRTSPAGYLLGLREQLNPRDVIDHARRTLRRRSSA